MSTVKINLLQCPHGAQALDVGNEDNGYRFAGSKHCGRWATVRSWTMTEAALRMASKEFLTLAEEIQAREMARQK